MLSLNYLEQSLLNLRVVNCGTEHRNIRKSLREKSVIYEVTEVLEARLR